MKNCESLIYSIAKVLPISKPLRYLFLFALLCTLGVGEMWGGTKRIYFDYSGYSDWPDASAKAIAHTWNSSGSHDYTMTRVAADQYYYYDIDDSYTDICFKREGPKGEDWGWTHTWSIGSNNRFKIKLEWGEYGTDEGKLLPADSNDAIRWAPGSTIDGLIDIHNPHNQAFSFNDPENVNLGTYSVTLAAHTTYQFKILEGTTAYGLDNNVFTANISNYASSSSGYAYRVATAGSGTYTFTWDKSTKKLTVTYPTVTHPNADYVYLYDHEWGFEKQYIHVWNSGSGIAETTWPGTKIPNTTTINGATYYYCTPGDYSNFKFSDGTHSNETGDLAQSGNLGKYYKSVNSSWGWHDFTFSVTLNTNEGTINAGNVTSYTFGTGATLPTNVTRPGYYFAGWYEESDFSGERVYSISTTENTNKTYYAKWELQWTIAGTWGATAWDKDAYPLDNVTTEDDGETYSCYIDIDLAANTNYSFKVISRGLNGSGQPAYWWQALKEPQTITYESDSKTTNAFAAQTDTQDKSCTLTSAGAGTYRFILNITDMTVTVVYPESYTVTFGYGIGGDELTASGSSSGSISSGGYVNKDEDITFSQTPATGYTFAGWYDASSGGSAISCMSSDNVYDDIAVDIAVYAQYTPNLYTITLDKNSGAGVNVPASVTATYDSPTLTTLTVNPYRNGYSFNGWYDGEGGSGNLIISTSKTLQPNTDYTDAEGNWTHDGHVTLYAKWTPRWAISGSWDSWDTNDHLLGNVGRNASSEDTCSVNISLAANTTYAFKVVNWKLDYDGAYTWLALENQGNMSYKTDTVTAAFDSQVTTTRDKSCTMRTAGAGTYKFAYNLSDKKVTVTYPTSYTVTFGSGTGGTVTGASGSVSGSITSGQYVAAGENVTFTSSPAVSSTLKGWFNASSGGSAISGMSSSDNVLDAIAANATVYAQWVSSNFVIYRTGDMEDDPRHLEGDVETYAGGKIDKPIEYRMKVSTLDQWYSLYLPFDVDAVQVIEDGIYYDIVPYYRSYVGGPFYQGHYIIRTPAKTTDFEIANFSDWRDPDTWKFTPAGNTPYVIMWHDEYFLNKYIAFFGHTDETIPTAMTPGDRPDKDSVVNVYGNNAMVSGSVKDGYTLEADYGQGAWLREETIGASRTVLPFECYLRANEATTPIFKALRRTDTATGLPMTDDPSPITEKMLINGQVVILRDNKMYNVLGMEIQ